jgi:hypothetical protein
MYGIAGNASSAREMMQQETSIQTLQFFYAKFLEAELQLPSPCKGL